MHPVEKGGVEVSFLPDDQTLLINWLTVPTSTPFNGSSCRRSASHSRYTTATNNGYVPLVINERRGKVRLSERSSNMKK